MYYVIKYTIETPVEEKAIFLQIKISCHFKQQKIILHYIS
jgi:hypothetical protein